MNRARLRAGQLASQPASQPAAHRWWHCASQGLSIRSTARSPLPLPRCAMLCSVCDAGTGVASDRPHSPRPVQSSLVQSACLLACRPTYLPPHWAFIANVVPSVVSPFPRLVAFKGRPPARAVLCCAVQSAATPPATMLLHSIDRHVVVVPQASYSRIPASSVPPPSLPPSLPSNPPPQVE